jgi:hypothetical protein
MLGWHISVYRQTDGGASPATNETPHGERLAVWQTGVRGLDWLSELSTAGKAIDLGGNGYPWRFTASAEHIIPKIILGPPEARETWHHDAGDILTDKWVGKTQVNGATAAICRPEEWLLVEAWDES